MKAGLMSRSFKFHSKCQPRAAAAGCGGGRMYWDFEVGLWHRPTELRGAAKQSAAGGSTDYLGGVNAALIRGCS